VAAVVVVGAGIAGVACARVLASAGVAVRVLDRAPEVGGRMASPRLAGRPVDLGAAYFTVRDPGFGEVVERWRAAGLARPWTDTLTVLPGRDRVSGPMRWAAPTGLQSLVADLADGLPGELGRRVRTVGPGPLVDGEPAEFVVLAMPDPQAGALVEPGSPTAAAVAAPPWVSAIAVAAGWRDREWPELPAAFVNDHAVLTAVADDGDRRGDRAAVLVAHTTDRVVEEFGAEPERAVPAVLAALRELLGVASAPLWTHTRQWRLASPGQARDRPFHLGEDGIAVAGDGWGSPRVETAWRSGTLLGHALVERLRAG
jgi:predicted NAD/FAD-dependent oxidoreductase